MGHPKHENRLLKKVVIVAESGCCVWTGRTNRNGYGVVRRGGRDALAHRDAHTVFNGPIPIGMLVCHRCDVRCCINPEHLWLGTNLDNMRDMVSKGRFSRRDCSGVLNGRAKLGQSDVRYIRGSSRSVGDLGSLFNVSSTTIRSIISGKTWRTLA